MKLTTSNFVVILKADMKGVFTRNRKLPIKTIILLVLKFKSSIQRELDRSFKEASRSDFNIREVTTDAFTQTRTKDQPDQCPGNCNRYAGVYLYEPSAGRFDGQRTAPFCIRDGVLTDFGKVSPVVSILFR